MVQTSQTNLGSYRLLNLARTGSACQIWEAMHDAKGLRCALKIVLPELAKNREQIGYLKQEFSVGSKLEHPRIIKIFDSGVADGRQYVALEWYAAPNLKQWIQQGPEKLLPLAPKIIQQAAEALSYLHSQGWIHRDIKPDNFLASAAGDVKLIDFALAQRQRGALGRLFSPRSRVQGTRSYMSPEQIRGQSLDQRADIYSFGCVVHELLSGKPPFTGNNANELLNKHLKSQPPSLESADRGISPAMAQLVRRMLAKEPAERPESMAQFLAEFRTLQVFKTPPPGTPGAEARQNPR